jgi:hypothetical protein
MKESLEGKLLVATLGGGVGSEFSGKMGFCCPLDIFDYSKPT